MRVIEVKSAKEEKDFFAFPLRLYKGNPYYVPQLTEDEKNEFDPEVNGAFAYAECKKFVCYNDAGDTVGRIAGIYHKAYNEKKNVKQIRFTRYDVIDDFEVSKALFNAVKGYAVEKGMNEIIGPIGFSDLDRQGMLVEGFDQTDLYITIYNFPYYNEHLTKLGFNKDVDWVEYRITVPEKMDERLADLAKKVAERYGYNYIVPHGYKSVEHLIKPALKGIMNEVFAHLYGVVEVNDKQIAREAEMLKQLWVDDFVMIITKGEELAGYGFMAPNISRAMQKCRGRILPFGIFHLLHDLKHYDTVDLYSIGVKKKFQNTGVNVMIMAKGMEGLIRHKVKYIETGPELEENSQIQAQWKNYEKKLHRRRRCYSISIDSL